MAENFVTLDGETYNALQQELAELRQQVITLQQATFTEPFRMARQRTLFNVIGTIRASLDIEVIFQKTATETRQLLSADRACVFRFDPDSGCEQGEFVSEDVTSGYTSVLATKVQDRCFGEQYAPHYVKGEMQIVADIYKAGLSECHLQILEQFQVRANLVVPLLLGERLWGLLCLHQCRGPRLWQSEEIEFVQQIAAHLSVALQQAELLEQTRSAAKELQELNQQLDVRVQERTAQLMLVNQALQAEIQERQRAAGALAVQERRFRDIASHLPGAIFQFISHEGRWRVDYVSEGIWELAGITAEAMIGDFNRFVERVHPDDLLDYMASVIEAVSDSKVWHYEGRLVKPNGEVCWWQGDSTPTCNEQGEIIFCGVLLDITARKQVEERLRQLNEELEGRVAERTQKLRSSEARFQKMAANVPGMICQFRLDGAGERSFPYASPGCLDLLEVAPANLLQVFDWIYPDDRAGFEQQIALSALTLSSFEYEWRVILPSGQTKWVRAISRPERQADGSVIWDGVWIDTTAHRQAELERDRFFNLSADLLSIANFDGYFTRVNPAFEVALGYTAEELLATPFVERVHPDDQALTATAMARMSRGEFNLSLENRVRCRDGSYKWLSWKGVPFVRDRVIYAIARDITERKQAEGLLENQRRRLSLLIEQSPLAVIEWNANFEIVEWNPAAEVIFGYSRSEVMGRFAPDLIIPKQVRKQVDRVLTQLNTATGGAYNINENMTKDGSIIICEWHNKPLSDANGEVIGGVSLVQDITERQRIQEEQARLLAILEATTDFVSTSDAEGRLLYMNQAGRKILGITEGQVVTEWSLREGHPPWVMNLLEKVALPVATREGVWMGETALINAQGQEIPLSQVILAHKSPEGEVEYFSTVARDISERKQVEQQLIETKNLYQQILDAIPDLVLCKGPGSRIVYGNKAFRNYYGMTLGMLNNLIDAPFVNPDYTQQYIQDDTYVFNTGRSLTTEEPIVRYDGEERLFNTIKTAIFDSQGQVIQTVGVSRDITERKQVETALQQQAQIINQVHDAVVETDLEGYITSWNQSAERLYGYPPQEAMGQHISFLYGSEQLEFFQTRIIKPIQEKGTHEIEVKIQRKSGEVMYALQGFTLLRNREQAVIGLVSSTMDISALKQTEIQLQKQAQDLENTLRELQRTQTQLVQSEKMSSLGQLVAGVAHEINNPVNFIYGNLIYVNEYAEQLLELIKIYQNAYPNPVEEVQEAIEEADLEFLVEDIPKLLNSMQVGAVRIREIVASLRNFSRIDEAECKEVNIHEGIDSTLTILHNRLKPKSDHPGIEVIKSYSDLPLVECYAGQLNQVFMNILVNAIDALEERDRSRTLEEIKQSPSEVRITTTFVPTTQTVKIQIHDNGPGIPETVRTRIFDPFFTTKPLGKGTGLGMAISYQIVTEKHCGTLACISPATGGAEFIIELPLSLTVNQSNDRGKKSSNQSDANFQE